MYIPQTCVRIMFQRCRLNHPSSGDQKCLNKLSWQPTKVFLWYSVSTKAVEPTDQNQNSKLHATMKWRNFGFSWWSVHFRSHHIEEGKVYLSVQTGRHTLYIDIYYYLPIRIIRSGYKNSAVVTKKTMQNIQLRDDERFLSVTQE